jgi:hypothetical protein
VLQGAQAFGELTLTVAGAHVLHHISLHTQFAGDAIAMEGEIHEHNGRGHHHDRDEHKDDRSGRTTHRRKGTTGSCNEIGL